MEVAWVLPCRFAEATPDGTATIVGAGLDSMWVPEVPADVGVFLMMRIAGPQYEFQDQHTVAVKLIDPEREEQDVLTAGFGPMDDGTGRFEVRIALTTAGCPLRAQLMQDVRHMVIL